jgi:hypothetical protein
MLPFDNKSEFALVVAEPGGVGGTARGEVLLVARVGQQAAVSDPEEDGRTEGDVASDLGKATAHRGPVAFREEERGRCDVAQRECDAHERTRTAAPMRV